MSIVKLLRTGGRLAVLGVVEHDPRLWHICRAGISLPILDSGGGDGLRVGRSLCDRDVVTNGYAADFKPPDGALCAACAERVDA